MRPKPLGLLLLALLLSGVAQANNYPTLARVEYVEQCQRSHPGPGYEMRSKCSCVIDHIASQIRYEEFEALKTASDAMSIGGERGGALRDNATVKPMIARWRALQSEAARACFIRLNP